MSCKKDKDTAVDGNNGITFLKVGTAYTYNYSGATVTSAVEQEAGKDTFLIRNYSQTIDTIFPSVYYSLKDGNFSRSIRLRDPSSYVLVCKFNQPVGTTWNVTDEYGRASVLTIDSVNAKVNTGKGLITDAIKVRKVTGNYTSFDYYSPTTGYIGQGSVGTSAPIQLTDYTISSVSPTGVAYPITFGNFPFTKIGNEWTFEESTASGKDNVTRSIDNKVGKSNIYKVKVTRESQPDIFTFEYWYEDHGRLMVYEDGENVLQADVVYIDESISKVGDGWVSKTKNGTVLLSRITNLSALQTTDWGQLQSEEIEIKNRDGLLVKDYWNKDKGNLLTTGDISRVLINSNARVSKF
ncbi:hypothetical protein [Sporocytophaga myxococcoides]|uniref:hypothetical protein n=1 Tax=Sporocytophaga myxococcoides TaxID=153721 RepID=UPI000422E303|nr:hypothetical protein [Sporocytophaga myxococcoides]